MNMGHSRFNSGSVSRDEVESPTGANLLSRHTTDMAPSFEFSVVVRADQVDAAKRTLNQLTEDVQTFLPGACILVISGNLGLIVLTEDGDVLDLDTFPRSLYERVVEFFGFGYYVLPGETRRGVSVLAAWSRK